MALLKPIFNISEICAAKGIEDVILCPGSRSAALALAFSKNPDICTKVLSDERSAAFVGMGMALQSQKTVGLVCTSGSAALNFAPAVSEAFFQEIPLLVLTADRPPEWIHQYDGQTIYQQEIYGKHVKRSFNLPADYDHPDALWAIQRIITEAIDLSQKHPKGPVHVNVPIREPFYPTETEQYNFTTNQAIAVNINTEKTIDKENWALLFEIWENAEKKMIAIGQNNDNLADILNQICTEDDVVVLADIISNAQADIFVNNHDGFLNKLSDTEFIPDLLITTGKSFISKSLKQFFRNHKPLMHWHIQDNDFLIDPFQSISHKIEVKPKYFFTELLETIDLKKVKNFEDQAFDFQALWLQTEEKTKTKIQKLINNQAFGEIKAIASVFENLPENSILHLGNSMPVRYANYLSSFIKSPIEVYANRGTSGIDGILSTAIGQAYKTTQMVTVIIGDVSFFYDINAFWNDDLPDNLNIVLINNAGGNIFRIIDGPAKQPECEKVFVANQTNNAEHIASIHQFEYYAVNTYETLIEALTKKQQKSIIEVFVDGKQDAEIFREFKAKL